MVIQVCITMLKPKNSNTYRGHMARLIEDLINEKQLDKAEEITDLAIEKMPVDIFGYYTFLNHL